MITEVTLISSLIEMEPMTSFDYRKLSPIEIEIKRRPG